MKSTNWKDIAELIGIAAIVASLLFVGLQMRQEQAIASSQLWSERNQVRAELASMIYANPQVWTDGLDGTEQSESDAVRFEAMAYLYFQKESAQYGQRNLGISPSPEHLIAKKLATMISSHPGLRAAWSRWLSGHHIGSPDNPFPRDVELYLEQFEDGTLTRVEIDSIVPP